MFKRIMVPVDLAHIDKMEHALGCAADLAGLYGAEVTYVGATAAAPSAVAHTPAEFAAKLRDFAGAQAAQRGIEAHDHMVMAHDPTTDLDDTLLRAVKDIDADLVVMASHVPGVAEYVWPSNGGKIAGHAKASVLVVRD